MKPFGGSIVGGFLMLELMSGSDFETNLLAGAVFFLLEFLLVVLLLPYFLQKRLDKRWAGARHYLCVALIQNVREMVEMLGNGRNDRAQDIQQHVRRFQADMRDTMQTYNQALNPELMKLGSEVLQSIAKLDSAILYLVSVHDGELAKRCLTICLERIDMMFDAIGEKQAASSGVQFLTRTISEVIDDFEARVRASQPSG